MRIWPAPGRQRRGLWPSSPTCRRRCSPAREIQLYFDFDWNGAAETLQTALALAPADPALLTAAGNLALARGDAAKAIELYRQAVALDPVNPQARSYLAFNLAVTRQFAEARAEYPRVVELNPAAPWAHAGLGLSFPPRGQL